MTLGISPVRSPLEPTPSSAGSLPEHVLIGAYARSEHRLADVEACACGERIRLTWPERIPDAVGAHNAAPQHVAWRAARESR